MKRVAIVLVLIFLILVALFLVSKPGNKMSVIPKTSVPQTASPSVTEELPPTQEQQEALTEASATIKPEEIAYVQLTEKTNIVEYRLKDATEWKNAELNQKFAAGDTLRTGSDSEAQFSFSDGSTVRLNGLTQITINPADKEINLSIGKIFVSFFKGSASPKVVTPNAVAAALGTMWVQEQKEDGTSQINVLEGQVNFTSEGASEIVDEGNFTKALHKKPPVKPQKFNVDNYAQSEKVLKKVKLKKLAELHKKHDITFQEKLKEHPELLKKYEEKVNRLKVEKKELIEKKLEEKKDIKPQIKEKIEEKKLQQNDNIKKQLDEKKVENIEKKKDLLKENLDEKKLQQNDNIKKQLEEKKAENIEKKKVIGPQVQEKIKENKLQPNEQIKPKIQDRIDENKLQQNEKVKKQLEDKKAENIEKKQLIKKEDNKNNIKPQDNKKLQLQEDNKKKLLDEKKKQIPQNPENKKKLMEEKKFPVDR